MPLGVAGNTARLQLEAASSSLPNAQGTAAVNSLGLLDLLQIAAVGLTPNSQYEVFLAEHNDESSGKLVPLAVLTTTLGTAGIVQAIGPLKTLAEGAKEEPQRFIIVTELNNPSNVVLRQSDVQSRSSGATADGP
jgi:hypothetical protein